MSKTLIIVLVLAIVAVLGYALIGPGIGTNAPVPSSSIPSTSKRATNAPYGAGKGRVVFVIKDGADASMRGATSVIVTVDKIEVHSAAQGWVTVSTASKQYDLLKLKQSGSAALLADATLASDTYDQIRLTISKVEVTAANKMHEAKLPSHMLKIVGKTQVNANETSAVTIDFIADKSLHVTGNGVYILAPVIKLETRSGANAEIKSDDDVMINGGKVEEEENEGVDEKGETKMNFELKDNLEVDSSDIIHIKGEVDMHDKLKINY